MRAIRENVFVSGTTISLVPSWSQANAKVCIGVTSACPMGTQVSDALRSVSVEVHRLTSEDMRVRLLRSLLPILGLKQSGEVRSPKRLRVLRRRPKRLRKVGVCFNLEANRRLEMSDPRRKCVLHSTMEPRDAHESLVGICTLVKPVGVKHTLFYGATRTVLNARFLPTVG